MKVGGKVYPPSFLGRSDSCHGNSYCIRHHQGANKDSIAANTMTTNSIMNDMDYNHMNKFVMIEIVVVVVVVVVVIDGSFVAINSPSSCTVEIERADWK